MNILFKKPAVTYDPYQYVLTFRVYKSQCAVSCITCTTLPPLHQEVESLQQENDSLRGQFLQHGRELLSQNNQSLAAEIEHASKEEVINLMIMFKSEAHVIT